MNRLIDFSLENRFLVIVFWLLAVVVGIDSLRKLPIDAVPDVTNVQVQVLANIPGLAPEEVERFVTFPVETAMSGLPRVEQIRSVSKFGLSVVTVVFEEGTDIYWARQLVGERLVAAREGIPEGYGEPEMGPISTGLGEIYQFEVRTDRPCPAGGPDTPDCHTSMELRTILDWTINYQLRSVPGVVEVNSFGGELRTLQVTVDPDRLLSYGLSITDVFEAVSANNRNVGGGYIEHHGEQYLVRGEGLIESLHDIGDIVLTTDERGTPVYVRSVATVEDAAMIRQGAVTRDGRGEAATGIVMMLMGENSRTVVERVKAKVETISKNLPEGVHIDAFYDRTELIDRTIHTVAKNLAEGGILVVLVLLLLLGSFRGGIIVALSIPLSMLVAFTAMRHAGVSGNLMSLGAIDFGLIVDGSVIMIENIVRVMHGSRGDNSQTALEKIRGAAHQVARPVVFAVAIIMIVYLPILALRGIEGKMFKPMAMTVVFALAASLACAMTLMPVLASFFLTRPSEKEPFLFRMARKAYEPLLGKTMAAPKLTIAVAVAVLFGALSIVPFMGAEFIPKLDEGSIAMQIWRLPSISLEQSNEISGMAERVVKEKFPEVTTVVSRTGRAEIATDPMGVEISDVFIMLKPRKEWRFDSKADLVEAIDKELQRAIPGALFSYSQPIELRVSELIAGVRSEIAIHVYGDDIDGLKAKADEVVRSVSKVRGAAEVKAEQTTGLPMLRVRIDRDAIARQGLNADDVLAVVEAVGGKTVGTIVEGQKRFDLQVRFAPDVRVSPDQIGDLRVAGPPRVDGDRSMVPLAQVARISVEEGPAQISREAISRRINVELGVRGRDIASFVADAQAAIDRDVRLPPGWRIEWGGQFKNLESARERLMVVVPAALAFILVLLYMTYGRMLDAARVFLGVPFAAVGGILALWLRGIPLSVSAAIGFIALSGVAVLADMVLVSTIRQLLDEGLPLRQAVVEAAVRRLRPVLMTALVASLGFVPMAISTSAGAEVQRPLATVVIGGLITSTVLTLLVLPAVYTWMARKGGDAEDRVGVAS